MKLMKNTLLIVSKIITIAISDRKAISNGVRDRDCDVKFDRDRNFRDRGHALLIGHQKDKQYMLNERFYLQKDVQH